MHAFICMEPALNPILMSRTFILYFILYFVAIMRTNSLRALQSPQAGMVLSLLQAAAAGLCLLLSCYPIGVITQVSSEDAHMKLLAQANPFFLS